MTTFATPSFAVELSEGWSVDSAPGSAIATRTAPHPSGFVPNLVLREATTDSELCAIAAASAQSLVDGLPGARLLELRAGAAQQGDESRQIWGMYPATVADAPITLLVVQQLVVSGGRVAELTATTPFADGPDAWTELLSVLDQLQRTTTDESVPVPAASAERPELDLDASARDGAAREQTSTIRHPRGVVTGSWMPTLSRAAWEDLQSLFGGGRLFSPSLEPGAATTAELVALDLATPEGKLSELGREIAQVVRKGAAWRVRLATDERVNLSGWMCEGAALLVFSDPLDPTSGLTLTIVPEEDTPRIVLSWADVVPAWPGTVVPADEQELSNGAWLVHVLESLADGTGIVWARGAEGGSVAVVDQSLPLWEQVSEICVDISHRG